MKNRLDPDGDRRLPFPAEDTTTHNINRDSSLKPSDVISASTNALEMQLYHSDKALEESVGLDSDRHSGHSSAADKSQPPTSDKRNHFQHLGSQPGIRSRPSHGILKQPASGLREPSTKTVEISSDHVLRHLPRDSVFSNDSESFSAENLRYPVLNNLEAISDNGWTDQNDVAGHIPWCAGRSTFNLHDRRAFTEPRPLPAIPNETAQRVDPINKPLFAPASSFLWAHDVSDVDFTRAAPPIDPRTSGEFQRTHSFRFRNLEQTTASGVGDISVEATNHSLPDTAEPSSDASETPSQVEATLRRFSHRHKDMTERIEAMEKRMETLNLLVAQPTAPMATLHAPSSALVSVPIERDLASDPISATVIREATASSNRPLAAVVSQVALPAGPTNSLNDLENSVHPQTNAEPAPVTEGKLKRPRLKRILESLVKKLEKDEKDPELEERRLRESEAREKFELARQGLLQATAERKSAERHSKGASSTSASGSSARSSRVSRRTATPLPSPTISSDGFYSGENHHIAERPKDQVAVTIPRAQTPPLHDPFAAATNLERRRPKPNPNSAPSRKTRPNPPPTPYPHPRGEAAHKLFPTQGLVGLSRSAIPATGVEREATDAEATPRPKRHLPDRTPFPRHDRPFSRISSNPSAVPFLPFSGVEVQSTAEEESHLATTPAVMFPTGGEVDAGPASSAGDDEDTDEETKQAPLYRRLAGHGRRMSAHIADPPRRRRKSLTESIRSIGSKVRESSRPGSRPGSRPQSCASVRGEDTD